MFENLRNFFIIKNFGNFRINNIAKILQFKKKKKKKKKKFLLKLNI